MNKYEVTVQNRFNPAWIIRQGTTQKNETEAIRAVMCTVTATTGQPEGNWDVKAEVAKWLPG